MQHEPAFFTTITLALLNAVAGGSLGRHAPIVRLVFAEQLTAPQGDAVPSLPLAPLDARG